MNNLKYYRKNKGLSQEDVAKKLGISTTAYGHYETGRRNPPIENLAKLADLYEVSVDVLMGRGSLEDIGRHLKEIPELYPEEETFLPLVASLRCGFGSSGEPFTCIKKIPVPSSYVRRWGENLQCVMAVGDSMSPTIIPGDILVCRPGDEWTDGNVVIVNVNDSDTVKRIYHTHDGGIDLKPDNPEYETIHYTPADIKRLQITVLGRVMIPIPKEL